MGIKDVERKPFEYVSYGPDYVAPTHMRKLPANEVVQRRVPLMPPTAIIADSSFRQAEAWNEFLARVDMPYYRYPVRWYAEANANGAHLVMRAEVLDRDSGACLYIEQSESIDMRSLEQAPQLIRMMLHRFALHEADECLLLDGKRITEVHNER